MKKKFKNKMKKKNKFFYKKNKKLFIKFLIELKIELKKS
jgi:hypothetical protein